ncbi:putative Beta-xylosidase C-terminal Concanavalin A-like domain-containing protein [Seiridium cardinale]|uniref:Beta-xylosidase C-terminal Concanavalin A-like domain-containing protein n=1 Tax=Seiridium cardinale TaxID=138064 RepID=A0ABR2XQU9_9PEZI
MPLATAASDEKAIVKCTTHALAEIAIQNNSANADFPITQLNSYEKRRHVFLIIGRPRELWNEDEGDVLVLY